MIVSRVIAIVCSFVILLVLASLVSKLHPPPPQQRLVIGVKSVVEEPDDVIVTEQADITYWLERKQSTLPPTKDDTTTPTEPLIVLEVPTDSQNVHDSYVVNGTKDLYLQGGSGRGNPERYDLTLVEWIRERKLDPIVDMIRKRNATITSLNNDDEVTVLIHVFRYARSDDRLLDELEYQIRDCKDPNYNGIVCPTGVVTRLISVKSFLEPDRSLRSKGLIRQELMQVVSHMESRPSKEAILSHLAQEYIGVLNRAQLDEMTSDWIEHVIDDDEWESVYSF